MRTRTTFLILTALLLALAVKLTVFATASEWWTAGIMCAMGIMLLITYLSTVRPITTLSNGMELLRGQDFSSRLAPVGQFDADRLVSMFNQMIARLKQERLRQQEQNTFLSLLTEASPMGIIIYDFDGNISLMNPAARKLMHGELAEAAERVKPDSTATVRLGDNSIFKVAHLHFMEMGFRRRFILIESLTEEVIRAERAAYGKVIRMIAHEVNNTMAGVKSLTETFACAIHPDDDMQLLLESCRERCTSMSKFITAYADVVKIPEPVKVSQDLNTFLQRQMPFLEAMAPSGINVTMNLSGTPALADFDATLMEQVIVNIVKNAIESIREDARPERKGEISITASSSPCAIEICDNGPGIAPEIAGRLFTPFLSTKPDGQGLGLMVISEILKKHGCRFSLATVSGSVTRFRIEF